MSSYSVNVINLSLLKQYKNSFDHEKDNFNNSAYRIFSSGYLNTCSDTYIRRMSRVLDEMYQTIKKGYNSIDSWWTSYIENVEGLEDSLSNTRSSGSISEGSLRSFVSSKMNELEDYNMLFSGIITTNNVSANVNFANNSVSSTTNTFTATSTQSVVNGSTVASSIQETESDSILEEIGAFISDATSLIFGWINDKIEDISSLLSKVGAMISRVTEKFTSKVNEIVDDSVSMVKDTGAYISSKAESLYNKVSNWWNDTKTSVKNFFVDVGTEISGRVQSITGEISNWWNGIEKWWSDEAWPRIKDASVVAWDTVKSVKATTAVAVQSLVEGILQFGEALVDFLALAGTVIITPFTCASDLGLALASSITGEEYESETKRQWKLTQSFVAKQHVSGWFDSLYQNTAYGNWLMQNAYGFDIVRSVGTGIGYVAGVVILTIATFGAGGAAVSGGSVAVTAGQTAIVAGTAGIGKGTETAWNNGADILEGLGAGVLTGLWEGLQFYIGGKIGSANIAGSGIGQKIFGQLGNFGTKFVNVLGRAVLDGADGGVEGFVQPLISSIYMDSYVDESGNEIQFTEEDNFAKRYKEMFDDAGGWGNVGIQTAIGSGLSLVGEVFDLTKLLKDDASIKASNNMEVKEAAAEVIENNIDKILNSKLSLSKTIGGLLTAPLNLFSRFINLDVVNSEKITKKILNEGLYHFTSLDSAAKILDSGYVKASSNFTSYGKKKSFFFAGIPTVEDLAVNVNIHPKTVAVKFDVSADSLGDFKYREFADDAITHEGKYVFDKEQATIVYLGLFEEDGNLVYKELSKTDFDNYSCNISSNKLASFVYGCKSTALGMARELEYFVENLNKLKTLFSGVNLKGTSSFVSTNFKSIFDGKIDLNSQVKNLYDFDQAEITGIGTSKKGLRINDIDPNVLALIDENTNAVFGYSSHSSQWGTYDWTDVNKVMKNRRIRELYLTKEYISELEVKGLMQSGCSLQNVADYAVKTRNESKIIARGSMTIKDRSMLAMRNIIKYGNSDFSKIQTNKLNNSMSEIYDSIIKSFELDGIDNLTDDVIYDKVIQVMSDKVGIDYVRGKSVAIGPDLDWCYRHKVEELKNKGISNPTREQVLIEIIRSSSKSDLELNTLLGLKQKEVK